MEEKSARKEQVELQNHQVSCGTADGALAGDNGTFRMVLPGEEGKLNVRMLAELEVTTQ